MKNDDAVMKRKLVAVLCVLRAMPHPDQVDDIDIHAKPAAVRFTWRGSRFQLAVSAASHSAHVEEVADGMLVRSNVAIMVERLVGWERASKSWTNE